MSGISIRWLKARLWVAGLWQAAYEPFYQTLRYLAIRRFVYDPRPDDVFIVSYPKSGTTLMQMIVYQLATGGEGDIDRLSHIEAVSPWFELDLDFDAGPYLAALPSPRAFKSHFTRGWLPKNGRFIYLARGLPDVTLSAYHHFVMISGRQVELEPFVDTFLGGHPMFTGSWCRHLRAWWPHRDDPAVLFVLYDEMITDLERTVRRVAAFCGIAVDGAAMPRILERCGIAYMRARNEKFDPRLPLRAPMDRGVLGRGRPGAGRGELSAPLRRRLADRLAAVARELGGTAGERLLRYEPEDGSEAVAEGGRDRRAETA